MANETLTGGTGDDVLIGGDGNDLINMGGNLTATDRIDGGADYDRVTLSGNYAAGVVFGATTMVNVEELDLAAGSSYKLTLDDATNSAGLTVNASGLLAGQSLTLD